MKSLPRPQLFSIVVVEADLTDRCDMPSLDVVPYPLEAPYRVAIELFHPNHRAPIAMIMIRSAGRHVQMIAT